ncbi:MAG: SagB/ThcOx family dehydrogenase [Synechococcus sp.]
MPFVSPAYHEFTKYDPETIATQGRQLDWSQQPQPYKTYPIGHRLELKPHLTLKKAESEASNRFLQRLSRLLQLSYGVTAVMPSDRPVYFRTAPSAGGLYPAELYVLSRGREELAAGVYNFQAIDHSLLKFWDECHWEDLASACFQHPQFETSSVVLVVTAVFFRSAWRYEDRAYRRLCLDSGHLLGNIELAANMTGFRAASIGEFRDDEIERLLSLDDREEGPLAILPLQDLLEQPSVKRYRLERELFAGEFDSPTEAVQRGEWLSYLHQHTRISASHPQSPTSSGESLTASRFWTELPPFPESATELPAAEDKYNFPFCDRIGMQISPISWGHMLQPLANTFLRRRSTRQFTGGNIPVDALRQLLNFAYHAEHYRPQGFDPQPDFFDLSLIETFVVANGVDGLDDGCYYYAPHAQELRQIRFKSFRQDLHYLCLGQNLGRDAAVAIVHTADLRQAIERFGDRGYRYLHMDAGHLGQKLNLAAVRLQLGVSGIAGFFDNLVNEVLGIPQNEAVLYITTIGQPPLSVDG